jgi:hypothetical protein
LTCWKSTSRWAQYSTIGQNQCRQLGGARWKERALESEPPLLNDGVVRSEGRLRRPDQMGEHCQIASSTSISRQRTAGTRRERSDGRYPAIGRILRRRAPPSNGWVSSPDFCNSEPAVKQSGHRVILAYLVSSTCRSGRSGASPILERSQVPPIAAGLSWPWRGVKVADTITPKLTTSAHAIEDRVWSSRATGRPQRDPGQRTSPCQAETRARTVDRPLR